MKVSVHSENEARTVSQRKLLPAGDYPARILQAIETTSKAGNEMIELLVAVHGKDGSNREFRDWLVGLNDRGALKLRHACEAIGELKKYDAGEIEAEDFVGKTVRVKIIIEKRRSFPDQNRIEDYKQHVG